MKKRELIGITPENRGHRPRLSKDEKTVKHTIYLPKSLKDAVIQAGQNRVRFVLRENFPPKSQSNAARQTHQILKVLYLHSSFLYCEILEIYQFCKSYDATIHYMQLMKERRLAFQDVVKLVKESLPGIAKELGDNFSELGNIKT